MLNSLKNRLVDLQSIIEEIFRVQMRPQRGLHLAVYNVKFETINLIVMAEKHLR